MMGLGLLLAGAANIIFTEFAAYKIATILSYSALGFFLSMIYAPLVKVVAENTVFAGKANYYINDEYDIDRIADVWFNFTTLRGRDNSMVEGELFQTSTGLLPVQYGGMPMNIYLVYEDGTYFLSETFEMPSLNFGEAAELVVDDFEEISVPVQGLAADRYMDSNPQPYDIIYWESNVYL